MAVNAPIVLPDFTSAGILAALGYTPLNKAGDTMTGDLMQGVANFYGWTGRAKLGSSANGTLDTLASNGTAATFLKIGSTSAGGIALKNNGGTQLVITRADETTSVSLSVGQVRYTGVTVAGLGAAGGIGAGGLAYVTDLTSSTRGSTAAGGGSTKGLVWSDGTNWIVV